MGSRWRLVAAVAVADVLLLVAALGAGLSHLGDHARPPPSGPESDIAISAEAAALPAPQPFGLDAVRARPWPSRATPTRDWSATMAAKGTRLGITTPGRVVGGIRQASYLAGPADPGTGRVAGGDEIVLPDGSRWSPQGRIQLEGTDDLPFRSATTYGQELTVLTESLEAVLASAGSGVAAVGTIVGSDGQRVERLALPPGTRRIRVCPPAIRCFNRDQPSPLQLTITTAPGLTIQAAGNGEAAVAGTVRATALDRSWSGLVGALEAEDLRVAAAFGAGQWTVTATGEDARQVWIDAWPVIDGELSAKGVVKKKPLVYAAGDGDYPLRIRWKNVGHASTHIFEAQGLGRGAARVGFDLSPDGGHDAGLGVSRGRKVVNLDKGADIDADLAPGKTVDRGLSYEPATEAAIVLRGNFPAVTVSLPVPSTAPQG